MRKSSRTGALIALISVAILRPWGPVAAQAPTSQASEVTAPVRSAGQFLYLPVYSNVWHGELDRSGRPQKTLVSVLVSIRNADPTRSIRVTSARYHDTAGKMVREYVTAAQTVGPLATLELFVQRTDDSGGSGASFVIAWSAERSVNAPVVEALHMDTPAGRPIVFTTRARPISLD